MDTDSFIVIKTDERQGLTLMNYDFKNHYRKERT